jgi:hypothetical protein
MNDILTGSRKKAGVAYTPAFVSQKVSQDRQWAPSHKSYEIHTECQPITVTPVT